MHGIPQNSVHRLPSRENRFCLLWKLFVARLPFFRQLLFCSAPRFYWLLCTGRKIRFCFAWNASNKLLTHLFVVVFGLASANEALIGYTTYSYPNIAYHPIYLPDLQHVIGKYNSMNFIEHFLGCHLIWASTAVSIFTYLSIKFKLGN